MSAALPLSVRAQHTSEQPISYFMRQAVENPHLISLAAGLVDAGSLPADEVNEVFSELLSDPARARAALQYGTTQGFAPLRDKLLHRIHDTLTGAVPSKLPEQERRAILEILRDTKKTLPAWFK